MLKIESLNDGFDGAHEKLAPDGVANHDSGEANTGDAVGDTVANAEHYWTVTRLAPGVRDQNRVNVFLDGKFAFSLDVAQVVDLEVKVGQKLDAERLQALQCASEFGKLYQRTLEWVLTRPHSVQETRDYLKRRKFKRQMLNRQRVRDEKRPLPEIQDDIAAQVLERLTERGYLDDLKFARYFVENRNARKGTSLKRLRMELKQKGVSEGQIQAALDEIPRDENAEMRKIIAKKRKKYDDQKLIAYLARQGFEFSAAKAAVEEYGQD